ncbi:hypothetical protein MSG28_014823 [Choristoneura fumiferana]|uniref:Uncharacterized protein n=1 Tax=Choristoneura fumiferana TaxID=7141 RepID=A0ACC0JTG0_CHOFU|nr:hypothetical protein MSG28_014823 [Choristoneura fumiferana]
MIALLESDKDLQRGNAALPLPQHVPEPRVHVVLLLHHAQQRARALQYGHGLFTDLGLHEKKICTRSDSFTDHGFHDKHIKWTRRKWQALRDARAKRRERGEGRYEYADLMSYPDNVDELSEQYIDGDGVEEDPVAENPLMYVNSAELETSQTEKPKKQLNSQNIHQRNIRRFQHGLDPPNPQPEYESDSEAVLGQSVDGHTHFCLSLAPLMRSLPLQQHSTAAHKPPSMNAIAPCLRRDGSSIYRQPIADRHSTWPEGVLTTFAKTRSSFKNSLSVLRQI